MKGQLRRCDKPPQRIDSGGQRAARLGAAAKDGKVRDGSDTLRDSKVAQLVDIDVCKALVLVLVRQFGKDGLDGEARLAPRRAKLAQYRFARGFGVAQ